MRLDLAEDILSNIKNKKVVVLGDIMLDEYIFGNVTRISPEAPVPIVNITNEYSTLGGAANVAANLKSLGADPYLIGILNTDLAGNRLVSILESKSIDVNGLVYTANPTITKTRIIGHQQQMMRLDRECINNLSDDVVWKIKSKLDVILPESASVIISDYAKNVIDSRIMDYIRVECSRLNIPWIVDPKPKHSSLYKGATLITPNMKELSGMSGLEVTSDSDVNFASNTLIFNLGISGVLTTRSEQGMTLISDDVPFFSIPTKAKEVYDVSGAGDTVIATLGAAMTTKCELKDAASLANIAAGIVVGKLGTATTTPEEILYYIKGQND